MDSFSIAEARARLPELIDRVCALDQWVVLKRRGRAPVALVRLDHLRGLEETVYLLSSPRNAERLSEAIAQLEASVAKGPLPPADQASANPRRS